MDTKKLQSGKTEQIFKKYSVEVAYLFGSQASGKTHADSDTDIAVKFSKRANLKKILMLANELTPFFKAPVEITDLDSAPLPLQYRIYRDRKLLYAKNPKAENLKMAKALCMYFDYKYYYDRYTAYEINRLATKGLY